MQDIDHGAAASSFPTATSARQVIFVNRFFYPDCSATSQILHDLAVRLAAAGLRVSVITSRQLYEQPGATLPARETVDGVEVYRVAGSRFGRQRLLGRAIDYASFFLAAFWMALRLLRTRDVLVAKTDPPMLSVPCALAARLRRARLINWLQDVFPEAVTAMEENPLPRLVSWALQKLRDGSMRRAVINVVIGDRMRNYLAARRGLSRGLRTMTNWADASNVRPLPPSGSALRETLGLQSQFVVGYSGNLGRAHDYSTLLGAADALRACKDVSFLVIGGGALMGKLKSEAAALKLDNMRFMPYQPRETLADSLAAADVHLACLRPKLERFIVPCKIYGILAAARPVVFYGDRDGELAQLIRAHDCGRAVTLGDGAGLARALLEIRDTADRGASMGQRGHALFLDRFTADRAAAGWLSMLAELGIVPVDTLPGAARMSLPGIVLPPAPVSVYP